MRLAWFLACMSMAACAGGATPGTEGATCRPDGTCLVGLACVANRCVARDIDGSAGSDASVDRGGNLPDATFLPDGDSRSPFVSIYHPGDGEVRMATSMIPFIGMGHDSAGAPLSGAQLVWTDTFGGITRVMGTGTLVAYTLGTVGDHLITLTGVDRFGYGAVSSIAVTAQ